MAVTTARVQVAGAAVALNSRGDGNAELTVLNQGQQPVWLGGPDVTSAYGYPLAPGLRMTVKVDMMDVLYAVADDAYPSTLAVLRS